MNRALRPDAAPHALLRHGIALALACAAISAQAQALWGGVSVGMSPAEVLAQHPKAVAPPDPGRYASGTELLRAQGLELVGRPFAARFVFQDGALKAVLLTPWPRLDHAETAGAFRELREVLAAKYGRELSHRESPGPVGTTATSTWISGETDITLSYVSTGPSGSFALLTIQYQAKISKEAAKL